VESRGVDLRLELDDSVPQLVCSDGKRYKQVLFNLVGNAIKFTMKGAIKVRQWFEEPFLWTEIKDTGIGIADDD